MNQLTLFYTTVATNSDAQKIALHLIEKKLIVCAQIIQCQTIFRWQGAIENNPEWILITKNNNRTCSAYATGNKKYSSICHSCNRTTANYNKS